MHCLAYDTVQGIMCTLREDDENENEKEEKEKTDCLFFSSFLVDGGW